MSEKVRKFSPRQQKALAILVSMPTVEKAAVKIGVNPKTVWAWLKNPEFRAELDRLRTGVVTDAIDRIKASAVAAVGALQLEMAQGKGASRVSAAKTLLDYVLGLRELDDVTDRLKRVEVLLEAYRLGDN